MDNQYIGYIEFIRHVNQISSPKFRFLIEIITLMIISIFLSSLFIMHSQFVDKSTCIEDIFHRNFPKSRFDLLTISIKDSKHLDDHPAPIKGDVAIKPRDRDPPTSNSIDKSTAQTNFNDQNQKRNGFYIFSSNSYLNSRDDNDHDLSFGDSAMDTGDRPEQKEITKRIKKSIFKTLSKLTGELLENDILNQPLSYITNSLISLIFKGRTDERKKEGALSVPEERSTSAVQKQSFVNYNQIYFTRDYERPAETSQGESEGRAETSPSDGETEASTGSSIINYEFSYQKGFLYMSSDIRRYYNVSSFHIDIYNNETCLGRSIHRWILGVFGYDIVIINNLVSSFMGRGYLKNLNENQIINLSSYSSPFRGDEINLTSVIYFIRRIIECNIIFFSVLVIFNISIRICESSVISLSSHLRNLRNLFISVIHNFLIIVVFIIIQIGYIDLFSFFISSEYLIFLVSTLVTCYFSTWCLKSKSSITYYPVMCLSVLYLLIHYIILFPSGFHPMAIYSSYSLIEYFFIFCLFNFEIPFVLNQLLHQDQQPQQAVQQPQQERQRAEQIQQINQNQNEQYHHEYFDNIDLEHQEREEQQII